MSTLLFEINSFGRQENAKLVQSLPIQKKPRKKSLSLHNLTKARTALAMGEVQSYLMQIR
jgi:hypothetical protein